MNTPTKTRNVGEINGFIDLLKSACADESTRSVLLDLLAEPDKQRRKTVQIWVSDLLIQHAPKDFTEAIACLADDAVAEKAYEVIFQCRR